MTQKHVGLIIAAAVLIILAGGAFAIVMQRQPESMPEAPPVATPAPEPEVPFMREAVIGASREGRNITAYTFGSGPTNLLFVGGIHGGYEWNSVLLAYAAIDHFSQNQSSVPPELTVTVIPNANPDGLFAVLGVEERFTFSDVPANETANPAGRFNAARVDLNRNFDCKWKPESMWRGATVSAGTEPFSEPEAQAIRDFVLANTPKAVVFWHSQSNAVYASECENGILPETRVVMDTYASAAGYPAVDTFDAYPVTGDAEGWLASIGIPAVTVELSTHETIEWTKNIAGIEALLAHYADVDSGTAR